MCAEIVRELIAAHKAHKNVNLNALIHGVTSRHKAHGIPKLVDIIAAIPEQYKKYLLPKLRVKPVRTASGVSKT